MACNCGTANTTTTVDSGGATTISTIHSDIILTNILTCLDGPSLASAASTCSQLKSLSSHQHLWSKICHSTWPSTNSPRVRHIISTFPNTSRSFFSDSFPAVNAAVSRISHHGNPESTRELISAVDLFHGEKLILSKVVETETESGWFRCSPFRVDLLDPKDSVETGMEYPKNEEACTDLGEELSLSWIVIDTKGKRAVNVSSLKAVSVKRHWLTGEVQVRFATVVDGGEKGSGKEVVLCSLTVTFGKEMMQVREASFQMEDMDGMHLNGRDSLGILQRALEGKRGRMRKENEGKKEYMEFLNMKEERKERKVRTERRLDIFCLTLAVLSVSALFTLFLR